MDTERNATKDLESYRDYLKLMADLQLNPRIRTKEGSSDIVQQTMMDAHIGIAGFRGTTEAELRAWLKTILIHNVLNVVKRYRTDKRDVKREISLQVQMEKSSVLFHSQLFSDQTTPSSNLNKEERTDQLAASLLRLLDDERNAIVLKYYHSWSCAEIAQHLGRTDVAIAGLLRRGLQKLREHLREEV